MSPDEEPSGKPRSLTPKGGNLATLLLSDWSLVTPNGHTSQGNLPSVRLFVLWYNINMEKKELKKGEPISSTDLFDLAESLKRKVNKIETVFNTEDFFGKEFDMIEDLIFEKFNIPRSCDNARNLLLDYEGGVFLRRSV